MGCISPRSLAETLRRLEFHGLATRHAYRETPPRVDYALTPLGRTLLAPIDHLGTWAEQHADAVLEAQDRAEREMTGDA